MFINICTVCLAFLGLTKSLGPIVSNLSQLKVKIEVTSLLLNIIMTVSIGLACVKD